MTLEIVVVVLGSVAISASVLALPMIPTIIEREMVMVKVGEAIFSDGQELITSLFGLSVCPFVRPSKEKIEYAISLNVSS